MHQCAWCRSISNTVRMFEIVCSEFRTRQFYSLPLLLPVSTSLPMMCIDYVYFIIKFSVILDLVSNFALLRPFFSCSFTFFSTHIKTFASPCEILWNIQLAYISWSSVTLLNVSVLSIMFFFVATCNYCCYYFKWLSFKDTWTALNIWLYSQKCWHFTISKCALWLRTEIEFQFDITLNIKWSFFIEICEIIDFIRAKGCCFLSYQLKR